MSEFPYDSSIEPTLLVCEVILSVAASSNQRTLTAVIDTGADATLIPLEQLKRLGAHRAFEANLRSQSGERRVVYLYLLDIQVGEMTLPGIYAVGDELGQEVILGRDVLNRLRLLLDGPASLTQLIVSKKKRGSKT